MLRAEGPREGGPGEEGHCVDDEEAGEQLGEDHLGRHLALEFERKGARDGRDGVEGGARHPQRDEQAEPAPRRVEERRDAGALRLRRDRRRGRLARGAHERLERRDAAGGGDGHKDPSRVHGEGEPGPEEGVRPQEGERAQPAEPDKAELRRERRVERRRCGAHDPAAGGEGRVAAALAVLREAPLEPLICGRDGALCVLDEVGGRERLAQPRAELRVLEDGGEVEVRRELLLRARVRHRRRELLAEVERGQHGLPLRCKGHPHTGSQVEEFLEPGSHVRRAQRVENVRPDARLEVRILIVVQLPVLLAREHCGAFATKA